MGRTNKYVKPAVIDIINRDDVLVKKDVLVQSYKTVYKGPMR